MKTDFRRALGFGVAALVVLAVLATPVAQAIGFERPGIGAVFGKAVGVGLLGTAMLLVVQTPVLFALGWLARGRMGVPRVGWAVVAGALAMVPITAMNLPGEPVWMKVGETLDAVWSQPLVSVSEWLPFVASGSVFGWHLFVPQRRNVETAG
jgi:hypothetical protein